MTEDRRNHDADMQKILTTFSKHDDEDVERARAVDERMDKIEQKLDKIILALFGDKDEEGLIKKWEPVFEAYSAMHWSFGTLVKIGGAILIIYGIFKIK